MKIIFPVCLLLALSAMPAPAAAPANAVQLAQPLDGTGSGLRETNLGDLIADAAAATAGTQIALIPDDEIVETTIPAGATDPQVIVHALSYYGDAADTVQVLNLTGKQIVAAIARSVSREPQSYQGFLQVSGLRVGVNHGTVTVQDSLGNALNSTASYRVAVTATLATGELGYFDVWGKDVKPLDTNTPLAESLSDYLASHRQISGVLENRITILD